MLRKLEDCPYELRIEVGSRRKAKKESRGVCEKEEGAAGLMGRR